MKYKYAVCTYKPDLGLLLEDFLNKKGADGWKLTSVILMQNILPPGINGIPRFEYVYQIIFKKPDNGSNDNTKGL